MLSRQAGVVCITTPDDAIAPTAVHLANRQPLARSGSFPLQWGLEFDGVTRLATVRCPGRFHASLYTPLERPLLIQILLRGVHWCIEGDTAAKHVARRLIGDLDGHVSEIHPEHKMLYHAAGSRGRQPDYRLDERQFLHARALRHCARAGACYADPSQRRRAPAHQSRGGSRGAGWPISRGDVATVAQHLEQFRTLPPVYEAVYRSLSGELVALARRKGAALPQRWQISRNLCRVDRCTRKRYTTLKLSPICSRRTRSWVILSRIVDRALAAAKPGTISDACRSIVYQQLSVKAAGTIMMRFLGLYDPDALTLRRCSVPRKTLRGIGLSRPKLSI